MTLLTTATIFSGICLLLLVLTGLKSGLIRQLHDNIMQSPSSIRGDWYANSRNLALDVAAEEALIAELPQGTIIIPEITKFVRLSMATNTVENVTLQTTVQGDPFLGHYGIKLSETAAEIVISPAIAEALGVSDEELKNGEQNASITLSRGKGSETVTAKLNVTIRSIVGDTSSKSRIAYLPRRYMEQLEDFTKGEAVIEHGWPGYPLEHSLGHQGYLAYNKGAYTESDLNRLHLRGFKAVSIPATTQDSSQANCRDLYGLLKPHKLHVYKITSETQNERFEQYLDFHVNEVEKITTADDVMLYWSEPTYAKIEKKNHLLIGVSGSLRWLRGYFRDMRTRFNRPALPHVMLLDSEKTSSVELELSGGQHLRLTALPVPTQIRVMRTSRFTKMADEVIQCWEDIASSFDSILPSRVAFFNYTKRWKQSEFRQKLIEVDRYNNSQGQQIAIVPAGLLSAIHRYRQGTLSFDPINQQFHRVNEPNKYFNGCFYARVLEDVPLIDDYLQKLGYSTVSSRLRVLEMQGYAGTLNLLVIFFKSFRLYWESSRPVLYSWR
ncbi:MAG: hypothetical protein MPJ24_05335 [Pirellulaceae bacterium]|nr:hypothetical protein [Pirellulaceae bacterium]